MRTGVSAVTNLPELREEAGRARNDLARTGTRSDIAPEPFEDEPRENPILGWAKAIVGGIGDTAKDMLDEGRRGAREAMEDGWDRFDRRPSTAANKSSGLRPIA